jgi:ligand-binding sensor domain-containing protein
MWFGTASGLNRYDGYSFKVFKHDVNNKNSVNDDFIISICEGPDKKLWITTRAGYSFYDPETEQFNNDVSSVINSFKLPGYPFVSKILHNSKGDFWFLCRDSGLYRYNELKRTATRYYHHHSSNPSLYSNSVTDIVQDATGNLWLAYNDGVVELFDVKRNAITYHTDIFKKAANNKGRDYSITIDSEGDLWVFSPNMDSGVYYYSRRTGRFRHITKESAETPLTSNNITNIIQADDGLIWMATDHGGINLLDKKSGKITYLLNREDDPKSLGQNTVTLYKDNNGIMWARTLREGVSYYHANNILVHTMGDEIKEGELPKQIKEAAEMYAGCVAGAIQKRVYLELMEANGFKNITVQKDKAIIIPDDILSQYLNTDEINRYRQSGVGIFSITVFAQKKKDECCDKSTCCK